MTADDEFSKHDLQRSLGLAAGYLDEAEDVLWTATSESPVPELDEELEGITNDVWDVQQRLQDLRAELEQPEE